VGQIDSHNGHYEKFRRAAAQRIGNRNALDAPQYRSLWAIADVNSAPFGKLLACALN
jgi:hypothetical protein